jgi:hypothetical protein
MMHMTDSKDEIAELRRELAQIKSTMQPLTGKDMERAVAEHIDAMHQAAEARMSRASAFSREDLQAMERATPTAMVQEIAMRDNRAPRGPSGEGIIPSSQGPLSAVRTGGGGTGWRDAVPLGPPPGINHVDRLLDHADAVDRQALMEAEARRVAARAKP